jgi:hypothetical protein
VFLGQHVDRRRQDLAGQQDAFLLRFLRVQDFAVLIDIHGTPSAVADAFRYGACGGNSKARSN